MPEFSWAVEAGLSEAEMLLRGGTTAAMDKLRELLSCGNPLVELGACWQVLQAWERLVHHRQLKEEVPVVRGGDRGSGVPQASRAPVRHQRH